MRLTPLLFAMLTTAVPAAWGAAPASKGDGLRMTVIPPGPVPDGARVEARVSIRNSTAGPLDYQAAFYWDAADAGQLIQSETITVEANAVALVRAWCPVPTEAGAHRLLFRVTGGGRAGGGVSRPVEVVRSETRARPVMQGVWLDPLALSNAVYPRDRPASEADVRNAVDALHGLGVSLLIITYVEYQGSFFYPSALRFHDRDMKREAGGEMFPFDVVGTVLSQADRRGMHVMLGLGRGGDAKLLWEFDAPDWKARNEHAVAIAQKVARELWDRYGKHDSFYGWYLTHEMNDLARSAPYYDPVADFCHALSPDTCVMVAPAGTPVITAEVLAASRVDVFAYQDAVGGGYVPYRYTYRPEERLAQLDEVFAGYRRLHEGSGKHLWADLEIWEMDGSRGYAGAYAAPFTRVRRQLELEAKHVEMITAYEGFGFLEDPAAAVKLNDPRAARLFTDYAACVRRFQPDGR